jgi:glutamine amidotransferase
MTRATATVAIFDYGAGNLHSLAKAVAAPGFDVAIVCDPVVAVDRQAYDCLVLPGVGAFAAAAERIAPGRKVLRAAIDDGFPLIGICLGMQLLFDSSEEGAGPGLGIIPGRVRRLRASRVPQIGWNTIEEFEGSEETTLDMAYYANSFVCEPRDERWVTAWSSYESDRFPAAVRAGPLGNVVGVQFHPEKSSNNGVRYLRRLLVRATQRDAEAPR